METTKEKKHSTGSEQFTRLHMTAPRTFSNQCHVLNKGAIDWSENGLLAYGANNLVVIVDTTKVIPVQCFTDHKALIKKVLWVPFDSVAGASSELVSADCTGDIALWDVCRGRCISWIDSEQAKPVSGLEWLPSSLNSDLLLGVLHSPYTFSILDVHKGTRLWKKTFCDTINNFAFDPFHQNKIAFLCPECILFFDNFDRKAPLSGNGHKFYISNTAAGENSTMSEESTRPRTRFKRLMKGLVLGESQPKMDATLTVSECIQFSYHRALRNHILLMYQHDILVIDLCISMTVGVISIDRSFSPFCQMYSCRQRDVIFCLQEVGSLSLKLRRKPIANYLMSPMDASPVTIAGNDSTTDTYLWYEHRIQSEIIRQTKNSKVLSFSVCPITEKHCAILLSMGKIMFFELEKLMTEPNDISFYLGRRDNHKITLSNIFPSFNDTQGLIPKVRLYSRGMFPSLESALTVIKYCPPLTSATRAKYKPLLAVGTNSGNLAIFNLATGLILKEYHVHSHPVRGIEWISQRYIISWSFYSYTSNTKSQVIVTDIQCGQSTPVRINKVDEPHVLFVKVSPLKQYFVIGIKDGPVEIWDLKSMSLLSKMSKRFPSAVSMEWVQCNLPKSSKKNSLTTPVIEENEIGSKYPEHLLISDIVGNLYAFLIDSNSFLKPGTTIEPGILLKSPVHLTCKLNVALQVDSDGNLFVWDLSNHIDKQKQHINRLEIRKLKFAPGAGNFRFLCLSSDGIDIFNVFGSPQSIEIISSMKTDKKLQIVDADWASAEHTVIMFSDQSIRVFDLKLTKSYSSIYNYEFDDLQGSPAILDRDLCKMFYFWLSATCEKIYSTELGFNNYELSLIKNASHSLPWIEFELCSKIAERALVVCQSLGLKNEVQFWTVAFHYIMMGDDYATNIVSPLDSCYDVVCDCATYRKMQLDQVLLHEWKSGDYMHMRRVVDKFILLGEKTRALNLLLSTNVNDPNYYTDALKACLIATVDSNTTNQSTIKLVAANLIAENKIDEGIQLLCMIGKGAQACRYLISYNRWDQAIWLAKCTLSKDDFDTVLKSWADYLLSNRNQEQAVLVLLSLRRFNDVLKILINCDHTYRAALLILACHQNNISLDSSLENEVYEKLKRELYINGGDSDIVEKLFNKKSFEEQTL